MLSTYLRALLALCLIAFGLYSAMTNGDPADAWGPLIMATLIGMDMKQS